MGRGVHWHLANVPGSTTTTTSCAQVIWILGQTLAPFDDDHYYLVPGVYMGFESLRLHGVDLSSNMDANGDTFVLLPSCEKVARSHH